MAFYIKLYLATLIAFIAIDMVWLGLVARTFYCKNRSMAHRETGVSRTP
jgi:uncharacterized membrane protein